MAREDQIRIIAYRIWQEQGCCDGHHVDHWVMAELIWEQEQKKRAASPRPTAAQPKRSARPSKKSKPAAEKPEKP